MVNISISDNQLIVASPSMEIFEWNHRAFFNITLGLELNTNGFYFSNDLNEFDSLIKDIIEYLEDEELNYEGDDVINKKISFFLKQDKEFDETLKEIENIAFEEVPTSSSFKRQLKSYQEKAVAHLLMLKHGANFSVPGSGKTTVVYAYYDKLKQAGIIDKIFVVGPLSSFFPWEQESIECFGKQLRSARLVGSKRSYVYHEPDKHDLFLSHYQTVANDLDEIIKICKKFKVLLVIDESHYIKRFFKGIWSESLLKLAPYASRRIILSGTPMPNGYIDLWSQFTFLWPGQQLLGDRNSYKHKVEDLNKVEEIKSRIRPFFFRVKKSDLGLPNQNFFKQYYDLKPIQAEIYNALSIRILKDLELEPDDRQALRLWRKAKMVRLLQSASNPSLLAKYSEEFAIPPLSSDGSSVIQLIQQYSEYEIPAKFEVAVSLIRKLISEGKKVLIWTTFIHNISMLDKLLSDIPHYIIHGQIPRDSTEDVEFNREKHIADFKNSKEPCVLIANPGACAESISLHKACNHAIYLDRSFNCGQYIQSLDRIHRIGSVEEVNYYILIANNTIDATIDRRLNEKWQTMTSVLEEEIPVVSLETDSFEMQFNDSEEEQDFKETILDIKKAFTDNQD